MLHRLVFAVLASALVAVAAGCNSDEVVKPKVQTGQTQPSNLKPVNASSGAASPTAKPE
jgi:hypothetical protein